MIYYALWAQALFLIPVIVFFHLTKFYPELASLKGLSVQPKLKAGNVVSISCDFDSFMKSHPALKERNLVVKALRSMCEDGKNGICHNPNLYLLDFRGRLRKFLLWILLGSHVPFLILLFLEIMPFAELVKYQVCCYVLTYMLAMALQYKYARFSRLFYETWHDKILNFDLLSVSMIRNDMEQIKKMSNSRDLLETVAKFTETNERLFSGLTLHTAMLSEKLDGLINLQERTNGITAENVLLTLQDSIVKYREINAHFQAISEHIRNSFESLTRLSDHKKEEINAVNKNSELLLELRENFKTYQSEAHKTELAQLKSIAGSLENNVSKTFLSIETAITQNFLRLEAGYDQFFDMCKALTETMSGDYEEKTASTLTLFFNKMASELATIKERTDRLSNVIEGTSGATKILCETVYDFTQYTMSPGFMGRIANYANFSRKLNDAADKLISYQKLAALGDVDVPRESATDKAEDYSG